MCKQWSAKGNSQKVIREEKVTKVIVKAKRTELEFGFFEVDFWVTLYVAWVPGAVYL